MGVAEFEEQNNEWLVRSHLVTYGSAADVEITERIRHEIEWMWNEPFRNKAEESVIPSVRFEISAQYSPNLDQLEVISNCDPLVNFFRIEPTALGNISFVDGIGCNTGYFQLDNLYEGSTTAAHEYGHTLGLPHPDDLDLRGQGQPGIMYPRGTLVDPEFQYNPSAVAGDNTNGGTMHPRFRKVLPEDIRQLKLRRQQRSTETLVLGEFSSVWHDRH